MKYLINYNIKRAWHDKLIDIFRKFYSVDTFTQVFPSFYTEYSKKDFKNDPRHYEWDYSNLAQLYL